MVHEVPLLAPTITAYKNSRVLSRRHYAVAAVSVRSKAAITGGLATHKQSLGTYLKNKVQGLT
jgi:hypothetical protein